MRKITNEELGRLSPAEFAKAEKMPVAIVLENIRSAHNIGAFFRTADAFAVQKIVLCGITSAPPSKEIHKSALGAELTVEWESAGDALMAINKLREDGWQIIAVEQVENAISLENYQVLKGEKYALVFGNEVNGVSQPVVYMANQAIEIPQVGTKHSLNVSVAGGIVLWHFFSKLSLL